MRHRDRRLLILRDVDEDVDVVERRVVALGPPIRLALGVVDADDEDVEAALPVADRRDGARLAVRAREDDLVDVAVELVET